MNALSKIAGLLLLLGVAMQPLLGAALLDLGAFDALAPRMLRLGRVALVALPLLTLLIASIEGAPRWERALAGHLALVGAVLMPSALLLAAFVHPAWKYLLPVPALTTTAAVLLATRLTWRQGLRSEAAGFLTLTATFLLGLTMGLFAFDGPLPSPAFIGAYGDDVRRALRGLHVGMSVLGLAALSLLRLLALARSSARRWRGAQNHAAASYSAAHDPGVLRSARGLWVALRRREARPLRARDRQDAGREHRRAALLSVWHS